MVASMLFNSWSFLVFFPIVTLLYFLAPFKVRWLLLLVASCIFYMAFMPIYLLVLASTIVIDGETQFDVMLKRAFSPAHDRLSDNR